MERNLFTAYRPPNLLLCYVFLHFYRGISEGIEQATEGGNQNQPSIGGAFTMKNEHLKLAIQYNQRFLEQAKTVIGKVQERQNDLLVLQQYPFMQTDELFQKAVTESYLAQTELCVKLSSQLTSSELCTWMAPDLYQSLYQKQQTQQAQAADIDLIQKDECVLIRMPHPLLRYHIKKTGAPFLDTLEQVLYHMPLPHGFAAQKVFAFWHIYPSAGWEHRSLPDNDNYLLKPIIDIVCRIWGMTDTGDDLALFYNSTRDDSVPDRTYLLIVTQKANLPFYDWHKVKTIFGL